MSVKIYQDNALQDVAGFVNSKADDMLGTTDISEVGDGTITGAIGALAALQIKSDTFSDTTEGGTGNLLINGKSISNCVIIAVKMDQGYTAYPFMWVTGDWYVHVMNTAGVAVTTATAISGTYYYIEYSNN